MIQKRDTHSKADLADDLNHWQILQSNIPISPSQFLSLNITDTHMESEGRTDEQTDICTDIQADGRTDRQITYIPRYIDHRYGDTEIHSIYTDIDVDNYIYIVLYTSI